MVLVSNNHIHLSPTLLTDATAIVTCMQDGSISATTSIPFPYTLQHAVTWLEDNQIFEEENGFAKDYAIRNSNNQLIGCIGVHYNYGLEADKSEFGYWLDKAWWNKGIMSAVIQQFSELIKQRGIKTMEAKVFEVNAPSQKVLVKNGFTLKGKTKTSCKKEQEPKEALLFVKQL